MPISNEEQHSAICDRTNWCLGLFEELLKRKLKPNDKSLASDSIEDVRRAHGRFTDWCGSLAAHQHGPLSLDERLRDASRIRQLVLDCLDGMEEALNSGDYPDLLGEQDGRG